VDPTGKLVYVSGTNPFAGNPDDPISRGMPNVSACLIGSNGELTPVMDSLSAAGVAGEVAVDPTGKFIYVTNVGTIGIRNARSSVFAFSVGSDGAMTPVPGSPFGVAAHVGSCFMLAVDPTGKFVYVTNPPGNSVSGYNIGSDGALSPIMGSPFATGPQPFSVVVESAGRFVYVTNEGDDNVSAYSIGDNGMLTPVPGSPFTAGTGPTSIAMDPTGRFVYVLNTDSDSVSAYSVGSSGMLTPVRGSPFAAGTKPTSLAITQ
jgi:DNA-binding beta-propeller fold protein YncE